MTGIRLLRPEQQDEWLGVLRQAWRYDFYHLPGYHALAEEWGEGRAQLIVYTEGDHLIALPLLLRSLHPIPGIQEANPAWQDATSVYGYAGPVSSAAEIPSAVAAHFHQALRETLQEQRVVTVFSRLHPLMAQRSVLHPLGQCVCRGQTVSIDLNLPVQEQLARYRKNHRKDIRRLQESGVRCVHDVDRAYLKPFADIYQQTMARVQASEQYRYGFDFFRRLTALLGSNMHLFVCLVHDELACGGLYGMCNGIVQSFLSGSSEQHCALPVKKVLVDGVRQWACAGKAQVLHLGGGVGAANDPVFHFKAGFSDQRHDFFTWHWVVLPDIYRTLCGQRTAWDREQGLRPASAGYFPEYRCPAVPGEIVPQEDSTETMTDHSAETRRLCAGASRDDLMSAL